MNRRYLAVLLLPAIGCARQPAPAVAVVPPPTPIATRAPLVVPEPTPLSDPKLAREQAIVVSELKRLKTASPRNDFEAAWARGDTRFVGVRGLGTDAPGLPQNRKDGLMDKYGVNAIDGTTDYIFIPEIAQLNKRATRYATSYNRLLLAKLDARGQAR